MHKIWVDLKIYDIVGEEKVDPDYIANLILICIFCIVSFIFMLFSYLCLPFFFLKFYDIIRCNCLGLWLLFMLL